MNGGRTHENNKQHKHVAKSSREETRKIHEKEEQIYANRLAAIG
jgi:hypothetical protein